MPSESAVAPLPTTVVSVDTQLAGLLAEVTQAFASSLNIEETLQHAITQIIAYLKAEAASIFLLEDDGQALVCRKCAGPVDITGLRLRPDQGIVGQTIRKNAAQIVRDVSQNPSFAAGVDQNTGFVTRSILCAPLNVRGQCIGALELINKRSGDGLFAMSDLHLASAVASAAALAIHNARMAQALVEQERVSKELELARAIQVGLLPTAEGRDHPIHGINEPAREVSGDFYDFFALPNGKLYFCIADVAGKGMNAALLMAKTTSLLRCLAKTIADPGELLERVNAELCETTSMGMFVTIIAGYIDRQARRVRFANAGHQPPLLRRLTGEYREIPAQFPPLGIAPEFTYRSEEIALETQSMYLFTDGITEAIGPNGLPLGVAGLRVALESVAGSERHLRLGEVVSLLRRERQRFHDDITLVLIEI